MNYNFQEGDLVKVKKPCSGSLVGKIYQLKIHKNSKRLRCFDKETKDYCCACVSNWILINDFDYKKLNNLLIKKYAAKNN